MEKIVREMRVRDENEVESGSDSDRGEAQWNSDDDFPEADRKSDSEWSVYEDATAIEALEKSIAAENAANPATKYLSKCKSISYTTRSFEFSRSNAYRRADNIVTGPKAVAAANIVDVKSAFLMFIRPIENVILNMTNLYGVGKYGDEWNNIDMDTLHAYFGMLLLSGVYRSYGESITHLWNEKTGPPIFRATMPLNTFKRIHGCIRFEDREERITTNAAVRDKLAPIRDVYDKWNHNLKTLYVPGKFVTVDEQLIPFRGRCPFRQYVPSKPAKYGIKVWVLCDSATSYVYNTQVYVGRDRNTAPVQNLGRRVVMDLIEGLSDRNITCDNLFTSYELAKNLNAKRMSILGTLRKNRTEIPPLLLDMREKPIFSSEVVYEHKLQAVMLSYVARRNRFVTLFSTYHNIVSINESDPKRTPNVLNDYNRTKGGYGTMDQMMATFTCKQKVKRWPMAVFCNILDVSALNAYVVFTALFPDWNNTKTNSNIRRRMFIEQLGKDLLTGHIEKRKRRPQNIDAENICEDMRQIRHSPSSSKRGRCHICTYKKNKNVFATRCDKCGNHICAEHNYNICERCTKQ